MVYFVVDIDSNLWMMDGLKIETHINGDVEFTEERVSWQLLDVCGKIKQIRSRYYGNIESNNEIQFCSKVRVLNEQNLFFEIDEEDEVLRQLRMKVEGDICDFHFNNQRRYLTIMENDGTVTIISKMDNKSKRISQKIRFLSSWNYKNFENTNCCVDEEGILMLSKNYGNFISFRMDIDVVKFVSYHCVVLLLGNQNVIIYGEINNSTKNIHFSSSAIIDISASESCILLLDDNNRLHSSYRGKINQIFSDIVEIEHSIVGIKKLAPNDPLILDQDNNLWKYKTANAQTYKFEKVIGAPAIRSFANENIELKRFGKTKRAH